MTRKAVLEKAIEITTGIRQQQHGNPDDVFGRVAMLWSAYTCIDIKAEDVCHMMTLLKMARMEQGETNPDDYVDAIGYEALAAELAGVNA